MNVFAQASEYTPPPGIAGWLACAMYVLVGGAAIFHIVRSMRADPTLDEQLEKMKTWVGTFFTSRTRHDGLAERVSGMHQENLDRFDAMTKAIEDLRDEVHAGNESIKQAGEERMSKLGDALMNMTNAVGELRGRAAQPLTQKSMPEKSDKPAAHVPINNALGRLVLEALDRADGYSIPESTLKETLRGMVRPEADDEDFRDTFTLLLQRDLIGFSNDAMTDERMFKLKEKGRNYRRDL